MLFIRIPKSFRKKIETERSRFRLFYGHKAAKQLLDRVLDEIYSQVCQPSYDKKMNKCFFKLWSEYKHIFDTKPKIDWLVDTEASDKAAQMTYDTYAFWNKCYLFFIDNYKHIDFIDVELGEYFKKVDDYINEKCKELLKTLRKKDYVMNREIYAKIYHSI